MPLQFSSSEFAPPRTLDVLVSGRDPGALLRVTRGIAQDVAQNIPNLSQSQSFGLALMNLLRQYQQLGTRPLVEQELGAREAQVQRLTTTPQELIGAAPSVQAGVRTAAIQALQPTITGAIGGQKTFTEQIKGLGDVLGQARQLLVDSETQQNRLRDDARGVIRDAFTIGGAEALKNLNPEELIRLEKEAGYPKGYIQGVGETLKERELQLRRELAELKASIPTPATGLERQTLAYYNRALSADQNTRNIEEQIIQSGLLGQLRQQYAPNFLKTGIGKLYLQAQRTFTEARLRKESGAAIPEFEIKNDAITYFAQPGDNQQVIEQKRLARQKVLEGLAFSAGPAYQEFYGTPFLSQGQTIKKGNRQFKVIP